MKTTIATVEERGELITDLLLLNMEGNPWRVEWSRINPKRTLSASALMWMWISIAAKELGYDKNDLHDALKERCDCPSRKITIDGSEHIIRSTRSLDTKQMSEYMDRIYRLIVGDLGIRLPLPEEAHLHG